jgi:putative oxidoreductase
MTLGQFFTDKPLIFSSLLLLGIWVWAKGGLHRPNGGGGETAAVTLLRIACGFLLTYASLDKLGDPAKFSQMVESFQILPSPIVLLAGMVMPWLEFFTGVCLMVGFKGRGAALIFCLLMALYAISLGWDLGTGVDVNCTCFPHSNEKVTWLTVGRDLIFFVLGLVVLFVPKTFAALDNFIRRRSL